MWWKNLKVLHLPLIQGAIDGTHILILKSSFYLEGYFYHVKAWGYFIVVQAIVNQKKITLMFLLIC